MRSEKTLARLHFYERRIDWADTYLRNTNLPFGVLVKNTLNPVFRSVDPRYPTPEWSFNRGPQQGGVRPAFKGSCESYAPSMAFGPLERLR